MKMLYKYTVISIIFSRIPDHNLYNLGLENYLFTMTIQEKGGKFITQVIIFCFFEFSNNICLSVQYSMLMES